MHQGDYRKVDLYQRGAALMDVGDTVTLVNNDVFRGTIVQMPRSVGRKRPRALVQSLQGQQWMFIDELKKVESE